MKLLKIYIPKAARCLIGVRKWTFFLFLIEFGYKAFGFSFNDFPFRQVLNGYEFNKRSCEEPTLYLDKKFDAVVSVGF